MPEPAAACMANIGPRERRKRRNAGIIFFAVALVILAALLAGGAARPWRLLLFLPFWVAALGYFQAREKT